MKTLMTFLSLVMPQLAPVLMATPDLINQFRNAFKKVGGKDKDFDAILAENQIQIDRLQNPDSFRRNKG